MQNQATAPATNQQAPSAPELLVKLLSREYAYYAMARYYIRNFTGRSLVDLGDLLRKAMEASEGRSKLLNEYCLTFSIAPSKTACTECVGSIGEKIPEASQTSDAIAALFDLQSVIVNEATQLAELVSSYPFVVHGLRDVAASVMREQVELRRLVG